VTFQTSSNNSIALDQIKSAIASRKIKASSDFRLCGIDQGRREDYLMVVDYFLPENWQRLSIAQIGEQAIRQVVYGGIIYRSAIATRLEELEVNYGIIDNEPDIAVAAELCSVTVLDMADQVGGFKDDFKLATVRDGGESYKCWKIRHERYLRAVTLNFLGGRVRLPDHWDKWITNRSELSPLRHLTAVSKVRVKPICTASARTWLKSLTLLKSSTPPLVKPVLNVLGLLLRQDLG
jgi:hypothetical protein